jgi:hypothetical protein
MRIRIPDPVSVIWCQGSEIRSRRIFLTISNLKVKRYLLNKLSLLFWVALKNRIISDSNQKHAVQLGSMTPRNITWKKGKVLNS